MILLLTACAAPLTEDTFPARYAESLCGYLMTCADQAEDFGNSYPACHHSILDDWERSWAPTIQWDVADAQACLDALDAEAEACDGNGYRTEECDRVLGL